MRADGGTGVEGCVAQRQLGRRSEIIEVEQSVVIHRPVREVFAFLADVENWTRLQSASRESGQGTSRGLMKVDDTFRQTLEIPGQRIELLCQVVELEKDERLSFEYSWHQLFLCISLLFEPYDGNTRLVARGEGRLDGFLVLFEPLVEREVNTQLKTKLDDLKNLLESRPVSK
jgi:hypothetical protein